LEPIEKTSEPRGGNFEEKQLCKGGQSPTSDGGKIPCYRETGRWSGGNGKRSRGARTHLPDNGGRQKKELLYAEGYKGDDLVELKQIDVVGEAMYREWGKEVDDKERQRIA